MAAASRGSFHSGKKTYIVFNEQYGGEGGFLGGSWVKNLPAMQETWVQSLRWEDPLEEGMATYSRIIAGRIPWTEGPGELHFIGSQRVGHN